MTWTPAAIPDLSGRRVLVTGVTSGLGTVIARELARKRAEVVLAARSPERLAATKSQLLQEVPGARLQSVVLDLADQTSVRRAADEVAALGALHLLINNAGIMATPYQRSVDGFEMQFATNHLGPFALTGLLLPSLVDSGDARVVSTASQAHRLTPTAPLRDPAEDPRRHSRWLAYAQSKLADLLFTFELDRRLREASLPVKALAAHPGFAATGLSRGFGPDLPRPLDRGFQRVFAAFGQSAEKGALPTLMAATADLPGSTYVGPDGPLQLWGSPRIVGARPLARDREAARQLWELSQEATGVRYP